MFKQVTLLKKSLFLSAACALSCTGAIAATSPAPKVQTDKQGILLVAFGTSQPGAKRSYDNIEKVISKKFPGLPLRWAYTSAFIRRKLKKQGTITYSVSEALDQMQQAGFSKIAVQSLHVSLGAEFLEIVTAIERFKCRTKSVKAITLGLPLLNSASDIDKCYQALLKVIPAARQADEAIVLMGHGNGHTGIGDTTYIATNAIFKQQNKNFFVGTVEGKPSFTDIQQQLKKQKIKNAYLLPLMVVAGDHACNDLAGAEADSWQSILTKQGINCKPILKGLGENDEIVEIFVDHLRTAINSLTNHKH